MLSQLSVLRKSNDVSTPKNSKDNPTLRKSKSEESVQVQYKATLFNASGFDAVFDVVKDSKVKDVKKMYSAEVSNPLSDMMYAMDPETNERPEPMGGGATMPTSVLTLVDDEGRKLEDEALLFPNEDSNPGFTAQVFIPTFEADEPELFEFLNSRCVFKDGSTEGLAQGCADLIYVSIMNSNYQVGPNHYLTMVHSSEKSENDRILEKMFFHVPNEVYTLALSKHCARKFYTLETFDKSAVFLGRAIIWGINRWKNVNDISAFFKKFIEYLGNTWLWSKELKERKILKPIMEALLTSKRVSGEAMVDHVFKKHLSDIQSSKHEKIIADEYFDVMQKWGIMAEN